MPTARAAGGRDDARVAVYLDFDNLVISRYDQVHSDKRDAWRSDNAWQHSPQDDGDDPVGARLVEATVDVGAVLDYAASYGTLALTRAYADWSVPANAGYRGQLVNRAVDLVQLFPVSGTKNGADIRLSVDAMEDLVNYDDVSHVVIVGGDSDYIALAQRCKQLGRFVVGIGVRGSSSRALIAACDEFSHYDALPGVPDSSQGKGRSKPAKKAASSKAAKKTTAKKSTAKKAAQKKTEPAEPDPVAEAAGLLARAMRIAQDKTVDDDWLNGGGVKSQMQRMDPSFKEKDLGFRNFAEFVKAQSDLVEARADDDGHVHLRLKG